MNDYELGSAVAVFAYELRRAGIAVNIARTLSTIDALTSTEPIDIGRLYWGMRLTLCGRRADIPTFDRVFAAAFSAEALATAPAGPDVPRRPTAYGRTDDEQSGLKPSDRDDAPLADESADCDGRAAGSAEAWRHRDIRKLTEEERTEVHRLIDELYVTMRNRRSMRYRTGGRSRVDVNRTARDMFAAGGEITRLRYRRRDVQPQRLLVLIDVSESTGDYHEACLRFGHAAVRARPAFTEVFTLGTRVARATTALSERDANAAMIAFARLPTARGGGTRLGMSLQEFLRVWGGHRAVRSATVVIFSDGWETGDPDLLEQQVARLKLLAARLIWVNPVAGGAGFRPMGALRTIWWLLDAHLSGHNLEALETLARMISAIHER
jgi:uncharacterized protein